MAKAVPTLSSAGWVRSPSEKADALISHFYESEYSQSYLYQNNVSNLQYLVERYSHDIVSFVQQLRLTLETYLGRHYDTANVDVNSDVSENLTGRVNVTVYCTVTEDGKEYSFGRLLMVANSKIEKIINLNNTGSAG